MGDSFLYKNIIVNDTYTITDRPCILHSITVNTSAAGSITIMDGANTVGVLKASIAEGTYTYDITLNQYLQIITASTSDITVAYKPTA